VANTSPTIITELPALLPFTRVQDSLPGFVTAEYPIFLQFVEAYYAWLSQSLDIDSRIANVSRSVDVSATFDEFIEHFKAQYAPVVDTDISTERLLAYAKHLYELRGTPLGYQLYWRLVFETSVSLRALSDDVLRASDGTWLTRRYLKVVTASDTSEFAGRQIFGLTSNASAIVERVTSYIQGSDTISELDLMPLSEVGTFAIGETITTDDDNDEVSAHVLGVLSGLTIVDSGHHYEPQTYANVTVGAGQGEGRGASVAVLDVSARRLNTLTIVNGGHGYIVGDPLTFTPTQANTSIVQDASAIVSRISAGRLASANGTLFKLEDNSGYLEHETVDYTPGTTVYLDPYLLVDIGAASYSSTPGDPLEGADIDSDIVLVQSADFFPFLVSGERTAYGEIREVAFRDRGQGYHTPPTVSINSLAANAWALTNSTSEWFSFSNASIVANTAGGMITRVAVIDSGHHYTQSPTIALTGYGDGTAQFTANIGTVSAPVGRWHHETRGLLSSRLRIQDGEVYQPFSYEIRSLETKAQFKSGVERLLHPAGLRYQTIVLAHELDEGSTGWLQAAYGSTVVNNAIEIIELYANIALQTTLTGTVTTQSGNVTIVGTGTLFTSEISNYDNLVLGAEVRRIVAVANNTRLTINSAFSSVYTANTAIRQFTGLNEPLEDWLSATEDEMTFIPSWT
jgi:hypothetical protein